MKHLPLVKLNKDGPIKIDSGDATPKRQPVHRVPFAVRQKVQHQVKKTESMGVVQPSNSPWTSPIVLVRKT